MVNERIKQLAEQAGGHYGEGLEFAVVFGELEDFEKFAELIVQECAELMEARKYADPDDSAEHYVNQGLATGVSLIKQHFRS